MNLGSFVCSFTLPSLECERIFYMIEHRWCNEHLAGVLEQINFEVDLHSGPGAPVRPKMILHEPRTVQIPIFRCFLSFAVVVET